MRLLLASQNPNKLRELRAALPGFFVVQIREPGAELSALSRSAALPVLLGFWRVLRNDVR